MINIGFPEPSLHPTMTDGKPMLADQQVLVAGVPLFAPSFLAAWSWYTRNLALICRVLLPTVIAAAAFLRARQLSLRSQQRLLAGC